MNNLKSKEDIFTALKNSIDNNKIKKEVKIENKLESGWDKIKTTPNTDYLTKPVNTWNKHDLRRYVNNEFFKRTGVSFPGSKTIPIIMSVFIEIQSKLSSRLQIDCKVEDIKKYIDYFYENLLFECTKKWKLSYNTFSYDCYINLYVEYFEKQKLISVNYRPQEILVNENKYSLTNMDNAIKVSKLYFMTEYGIVLFYQYLLKKEYDNIDKIITDSIKKIKNNEDIELIISETKKNEYPEWFKLDIILNMLKNINIEIDIKKTNTSNFDFLKKENK